jgi:hypothetical protein
MKIHKMSLAALGVLLAWTAPNAQAAHKDFEVKYRQAILEDGRLIHQARRQPYGFRVEILSDDDSVKVETFKNGYPFIAASKEERYSVRLYNPLPVRVAVNLTVDGLNSITGKPSGIEDGQKWMIDPNSFITIPGWQVSGGEARRFFFTGKTKSYAQWRGEELGKDLAANCGVIGAAYFWSQRELNQYYDDHPLYRYTQRFWPFTANRQKSSQEPSKKAEGACKGMAQAPSCASGAQYDDMKMAREEEQAGTGMGERESHPTFQVSFDYDSGMYSLSQALVIYYGFHEAPVPNPFPSLGYAPEMSLR